jgi:hypothetical protein
MIRSAPLPAYEVSVAKLDGAPYVTTTISVAGQVVRSQLGRMSIHEIEAAVRAHIAPEPLRMPVPFHYSQTRKRKEPREIYDAEGDL